MFKDTPEIKAPVAWLPVGLISWYTADGSPVALVTSWLALLGGPGPRVRTAWHGRQALLPNLWAGGDFVLNLPCAAGLAEIRNVMLQGKLCLNVEKELSFSSVEGVVAVAPRLVDCAIQIECMGGQLVAGLETELCGDVVRVHRGSVVIDPAEVSDLCAIRPLSLL